MENRINELQGIISVTGERLREAEKYAASVANLYGDLKASFHDLSALKRVQDSNVLERRLSDLGISVSSEWRKRENPRLSTFEMVEAVHRAAQAEVRSLRNERQSAARARRALRRRVQGRPFNLDRFRDEEGRLPKHLVLGGGCNCFHVPCGVHTHAMRGGEGFSRVRAEKQAKKNKKKAQQHESAH